MTRLPTLQTRLSVIKHDDSIRYQRIEITRTSDEKRISRKDSPVIAIFEQEADTILRVTWRVQRFYADIFADAKGLAMCRRLRDFVAVTAANDW